MTTHGPIYQMVEQEIKKTKIKNWNGAGYMLQALEPLLPKIQELEPRWIPVEERLPKEIYDENGNFKKYLTYNTKSGRTEEMSFSGKEFNHGFGLPPTHWQPLLLPPTK